jgi:predicted Fe-S protein YdhL (DUF1289 family)
MPMMNCLRSCNDFLPPGKLVAGLLCRWATGRFYRVCRERPTAHARKTAVRPGQSPHAVAQSQISRGSFPASAGNASEEREDYLTNRPPELRVRILAKVAEYEAFDPNERELRLRATELRWYLMPLLRDSPTNRPARLAQIPDDVRDLVQARLDGWVLLPPTLQQEFLDNEHILLYFARLDVSNRTPELSITVPSGAERAHWDSLSEPERRQVAAGFNHLFELSAEEKQLALNTLSEAERQQMEATLKSFAKMPPDQRAECENAFARFASMTTLEKAEFLKSAERWSAMSPAERQAWRDLVVNVPQWPPLPIGFMMPVPGAAKPGMATNLN